MDRNQSNIADREYRSRLRLLGEAERDWNLFAHWVESPIEPWWFAKTFRAATDKQQEEISALLQQLNDAIQANKDVLEKKVRDLEQEYATKLAAAKRKLDTGKHYMGHSTHDRGTHQLLRETQSRFGKLIQEAQDAGAAVYYWRSAYEKAIQQGMYLRKFFNGHPMRLGPVGQERLRVIEKLYEANKSVPARAGSEKYWSRVQELKDENEKLHEALDAAPENDLRERVSQLRDQLAFLLSRVMSLQSDEENDKMLEDMRKWSKS